MAAETERRHHYRVITRIVPRRASWFDEDEVTLRAFDAIILDISGGGMLIQSRDRLPPGTRLSVIFAVDGDPVEFDVRAVVVGVHTTPPSAGRMSSNTFRIHATFTDLPRLDAERIVRYVYRQQLQLRRRGVL